MADSIEAEGTGEQMAQQRPAAAAPYHYRMANNRIKRLPSGDIRHCLGMQSNKDIIRCSETRRRK